MRVPAERRIQPIEYLRSRQADRLGMDDLNRVPGDEAAQRVDGEHRDGVAAPMADWRG